VYDLTNQASF